MTMSKKKVIVKSAQFHPELRRDGRAVHRQDRHADHGPRHSGNPLATFFQKGERGSPARRYLISHFQTGLKNVLVPRGAEVLGTAPSNVLRLKNSPKRMKFRSIFRADMMSRGRDGRGDGQRQDLTRARRIGYCQMHAL